MFSLCKVLSSGGDWYGEHNIKDDNKKDPKNAECILHTRKI